MQGKRRFDLDGKYEWDEQTRPQPGDYWKDDGSSFYACDPKGNVGWLSNHTVTEREDGTITVEPSILITSPGQPEKEYHGYLKEGVWTEC